MQGSGLHARPYVVTILYLYPVGPGPPLQAGRSSQYTGLLCGFGYRHVSHGGGGAGAGAGAGAGGSGGGGGGGGGAGAVGVTELDALEAADTIP